MKNVEYQREGMNVIMGVAPGWIFTGKVESESESEIVLSPANYFENTSKPWPLAAQDPELITKATHIDSLTIRKSAVLWVSECCEGTANVGSAQAIKKA